MAAEEETQTYLRAGRTALEAALDRGTLATVLVSILSAATALIPFWLAAPAVVLCLPAIWMHCWRCERGGRRRATDADSFGCDGGDGGGGG